MKKKILKLLMNRAKHLGCVKYLPYINFSFSQDGEDIDLKNLFNGISKGFYVDLGCYHPIQYSNTFVLYRKGWKGMNVDATPGVKEMFDKMRPRDININCGISERGNGEELTYYMFDNETINTFDDHAAKRSIDLGCNLIERKKVKTYTVTEIFEKYLPEGQEIDVLDIDLEGYDRVVISQMDWNKYRPSVIIAESARDIDNFIYETMKNAGYILRCRSVRNDMYILEEKVDELVSNIYNI